MGSIVRCALLAGTMVAVSACSSIQNHRGYIVDETLVAAVQPGLDNQQSVRGTLGLPTMTSQFGPPVWYYVSSITGQSPFRQPAIREHSVLAVHFDAAGNVVSTERSGMELVAQIDPENDETPTLGRERTFLEDLFGNIGTVGTALPGAGAGGGG